MNSDNLDKIQNADDIYRDYYNLYNRTYPEIYDRISPYIENALYGLGVRNNLTDEEINILTERIIDESNIMTNPPANHNRETVFDFIKLIILKALEDDDLYDYDLDDDYDDFDDASIPTIGPFEYYPHPYPYIFLDGPWGLPPYFFGRRRGYWGYGRRNRNNRRNKR